MKTLIRKRVNLIGDHPWRGHAGTIQAVERVHALGKDKFRVRLDDGHECYAGIDDIHLVDEAPVMSCPSPFHTGKWA